MARARRRRGRFPYALTAAGLILLSAPVWGPEVGRRLPWFDVDRVEISGASLVPPHEVLNLSGIGEGTSVLDPRGPWESALLSHPAIADVRVSMRLPGTLRLRVVEKRAVALVGDETLVPATATGETLPVDPTSAPLDLPIVSGSPHDPENGADVRRLLAEIGRLAELDPSLMHQISEARLLDDAPDAIRLVHPIGEIVLPFGVDRERLEHLAAVLRDATARLARASGDPPTGARVDLRFDGQVVVRHSSLRRDS